MALPNQMLTLEEFLRLPEAKPVLEFVDGKVRQKVAPRGKHGRLQFMFAAWVNDYAEPRSLAMAFPEPRVTLGGQVRVPDVAVYRWERIPWEPNGEVPDVFVTPPALVLEVQSPGQRLSALLADARWYVEQGADIAVLADPTTHQVYVARAAGLIGPLAADDVLDFAPVPPGRRLSVRELFGWPRPGGRGARLDPDG